MVAVSVEEAGNPGHAHRLTSNLRRKILYHLVRRRQRFLCEVLNVLYELRLLVLVEFLSGDFPGLWRPLTALVPPRERRSRHVEPIRNFCIREVFSIFERFDCRKI